MIRAITCLLLLALILYAFDILIYMHICNVRPPQCTRLTAPDHISRLESSARHYFMQSTVMVVHHFLVRVSFPRQSQFPFAIIWTCPGMILKGH